MKSLEERKLRALELRAAGCSCATAVLMSFDDVTGLPEETALSVTNGLGTGIAGTREICGAATAMAIVEGFLHPASPKEKAKVATAARDLIGKFSESNNGYLRCADLKSRQINKEIRPCNDLVLECIELLHNRIANAGHAAL